MKSKLIQRIIFDFAKGNDKKYEESFSLQGYEGEVFTIRIERNKEHLINESISMEALSNTISALPSGSPCGCCGGSGKSS